MILGIDLGQRKTGLAISQGKFATPYKTLSHLSLNGAIFKIVEICDDQMITKVIVGYVEGKIKSYFTRFAKELNKHRPNLDVILWDETLTSQQARSSMIELGISSKKRKAHEHQKAACIILQSFLDSL